MLPLFHLAILAILSLLPCNALYRGAFIPPKSWDFESRSMNGFSYLSDTWKSEQKIKFIVALKKKNVPQMHQHLLKVSDPKSSEYGSFLSREEIRELYGPTPAQTNNVMKYFETIPEVTLFLPEDGDLLEVTATVEQVEKFFETKLDWVSNTRHPELHPQKAIRATQAIHLPEEIAQDIKFISLNAPLNFIKARGAKVLKSMEAGKAKESVSVSGGNEAALVTFIPTCADGTTNVNNPPCTQDTTPPSFDFDVYSYANSAEDPYQLSTAPFSFHVKNSFVYCYANDTSTACTGVESSSVICTCVTQLSPLPKYTQLKANGTINYGSGFKGSLGLSNFFALTDVATPRFLSQLYNIPPGIQVNHNSNQSVAEFYKEFYSNSDLEQFFSLTGLPNATIPSANVLGDLPNNQSNPGGEAQLDVEYLMALAPGAKTYFYSMKGLNRYDPINEDFLSYLNEIDKMKYPPLVHSLSYGDVEADIFNVTNPGSSEFGESCDEKFMEYGLQGLTFLFSSGDDGIGGTFVRDDIDYGCSHSWPSWPASSPYVTTVGATQLTDKYLPICGQNYASKTVPLPESISLPFQCTGTGETVCTAIFGGVITSGGGFSNVNNRSYAAPWQQKVVDNYLRKENSAAYPPSYYFNPGGRGYPDVATYGSNYFVYLDGKIQRESGTSASAPVFAAMVTLWNDIRLAYGKSPMGFIAPFLYDVYSSHPEAFNDVTTGDNACSVGSSLSNTNCCDYAFAASSGWDAVTGLGSPNFEIISNLVINNKTDFPNLAAYPQGRGDSYITSDSGDSDDDDNNTHDLALSSIIIAPIAFVLALVALVLVLYRMTLEEKFTQSEVNNALLSEQTNKA